MLGPIGRTGELSSPLPPRAPKKDEGLCKANMKKYSWRINNLYHIIDDNGVSIPFRPREAQKQMLRDLWFRNLVLKSRKLGFTTIIDLNGLDRALFSRNQDIQIISETMSSAKRIFTRIIKHAYDNLPREVKEFVPQTSCSQTQMEFSNGSMITCGTSARSTTPTYLHISEFGPISAKFPDKAREIITGSILAVSTSGQQLVFVESTAMGKNNAFYDMVQRAQRLKDSKQELSKLDMKLLFFPWYLKPENRLENGGAEITDKLKEYFEKLKVPLDDAQKRWYATQYDILGPDMMAEHPSTPEEPFMVLIEGAYFSHQFRKIYSQNRICKVPFEPGIPVDTWWDLGMNDVMVIWFSQTTQRGLNFIDYYENNNEGLQHYVNVLSARGYNYGIHHGPHDLSVRELGTGKSRVQQAAEMGLKMKVIPRVQNKLDSIEAARRLLDFCWFDEEKCADGIVHLEQYRKEWNETRGCWGDKPLHDSHSNGADAFQTCAMGIGKTIGKIVGVKLTESISDWTQNDW